MPSHDTESSNARRLRLGMVGGGPGAFIGAVHRIAARLDDKYELVAGVPTSNPERSRLAAGELHLHRVYGTFDEMADGEARHAEGIDAVAIVTPNNLHHPIAKRFLEAGIHVICDKPVTLTVDEALDLEKIVRKTGLVFGVTYNYTGYPLVREARELIAAGEIGAVRTIQVEYAQQWLTTNLETTGQKQAEWRVDPARSGPGGALGDIGTHAINLATFISGLPCEKVAADASAFIAGRRVPDNVQIILRFAGGAKGALWVSQVAPGNENHLQIRVYGERGGLEWCQEDPDRLVYSKYGELPCVIRRGVGGRSAAATRATRIPAGHPEGYLEAFAQIYTDLAEQIWAAKQGRKPDPQALLVPGISSGIEGMRFVAAVLESSKRDSSWVAL